MRSFLQSLVVSAVFALPSLALAKTVKKTPAAKRSAAPTTPAPVPDKKKEPVLSEPERDFSRAEELFKSGQEDAATLSLTDYLRRYPTGARADDAQYLLGEIEFRRRNFEAAIIELKKTLNYRQSGGDRIPDAFYLIGECLQHLGQTEKARIEWEALRRAYPNSPAAGRAYLKLMELK